MSYQMDPGNCAKFQEKMVSPFTDPFISIMGLTMTTPTTRPNPFYMFEILFCIMLQIREE